ncbi:MAG: DUF2071 domain-containing protein [Anaerolineaceae bacterium]|nr:DUF2071 domain-containing protein [Anaerolineaceae bacterium]
MSAHAPFLTAEWRNLILLNYRIEPAVLEPYIPLGTELDCWDGQAIISLVGFMFLKTHIAGVAIPFHTNFEEVNLRFYARHKTGSDWLRGVVFVREIVPRFAIAAVADLLYGEKYTALPMRHTLASARKTLCAGDRIEYAWKLPGKWNHLGVRITGEPQYAQPGSQEEFITEHYWGYAAQRSGAAMKYGVEHPSWRLWQVSETSVDCDVERMYGSRFVESLKAGPVSAFLAEGSHVAVYTGSRLT